MADVLAPAMADAIRRRKGGRSHGMESAPAVAPDLAPLVQQIFEQYPAIGRHANEFAVMRGRPMLPGDDRQLESYAPDESWNPIPGKATTELYNSAVPLAEQRQIIAGDMLHHLADADPTWAAMKQAVVPQEMQADPQVYRSRGDEFLMGYLTPDAQDNWRNVYTPEQRRQLAAMADYLRRGTLAPGMR